jgi:hypothetical protein
VASDRSAGPPKPGLVSRRLNSIPTVKLWGWRLPNTKLHAAETAIPAMGGPPFESGLTDFCLQLSGSAKSSRKSRNGIVGAPFQVIVHPASNRAVGKRFQNQSKPPLPVFLFWVEFLVLTKTSKNFT